jgi:hypothetical protein
MVQSKLSAPVRRACQAQENDHSEHRDARDNDHGHPRRFRIARTIVAILPGGPARVNGTRVTLVSVLPYRVPPVHPPRVGDELEGAVDTDWKQPHFVTGRHWKTAALLNGF